MKARMLCERLGVDINAFSGCEFDNLGLFTFKINIDDKYVIDFHYNNHTFELYIQMCDYYNETIMWNTHLNIFSDSFGDIDISDYNMEYIYKLKELLNNGIFFEILNYDDDLDEYMLYKSIYSLNILNGGKFNNIIYNGDYSNIGIDTYYTNNNSTSKYLSNGCIIKPGIHFENKQKLLDYFQYDYNHILFLGGAQYNNLFVNDLDKFTNRLKTIIDISL